ncbi:uncharacterized protein FYW49_014752 [Xenentodon cancila]
MLLRVFLQTSLILCLAQQTLQGVTGALGALGSRYGTKAMKTGLGRYPGAHLGVGGYRSLGLGAKAGLKQGGYVNPGAYGANLGTGVGLGPGLPNGLGLGLGHAGKRGYGAGLGTLPGYGAYAGIGYPGLRQGVSAADLGGPEMASLGQAGQDLKREQNRGLGHSYGKEDLPHGLEVPSIRQSSRFGSTVPELHANIDVKRLNPGVQSSSLRPGLPLDNQTKIHGLAVSQAPAEHEAKSKISPEATLAAGDERRQLAADKDNIRSLGSASSLGHGHIGGAGNYLGANMGAGGYGAGLGHGTYLGGAAGKLGAAAGLGQGGYPHGVGGKTNGYNDGATGYLGAAAGNGFGYGNGYSDGLGAELGYPAELADVAENKAGKSKAVGNGAYAGQAQGGYGAYGAGLESAGGKYGGGAAAQGPYGNAPVIPAGLEGDGGYPFASQPLSLAAEGAKTSSKYGYGSQLGVTHDALGKPETQRLPLS